MKRLKTTNIFKKVLRPCLRGICPRLAPVFHTGTVQYPVFISRLLLLSLNIFHIHMYKHLSFSCKTSIKTISASPFYFSKSTNIYLKDHQVKLFSGYFRRAFSLEARRLVRAERWQSAGIAARFHLPHNTARREGYKSTQK